MSCHSASIYFTCARGGPVPGPALAGAVPCVLWQSGMLEGAEAVVVPELPSASSHWELCRQRGHASAREGDRLSRPPQPGVLPGELRNLKGMLAKCP